MVEKIISVFNKIKRKIENEELDMVISPRNLENWAKLAKYEGYVSAAEKTIYLLQNVTEYLKRQ